jgi:hypothetical protein
MEWVCAMVEALIPSYRFAEADSTLNASLGGFEAWRQKY